jgi:hypothetical protein
MRTIAITCIALLITNACGARSSASSARVRDSSGVVTRPVSSTAQQSDTTFVEIDRSTRHGTPLPGGGCSWTGGVPTDFSLPKGAFYVEHPVSSDPATCTVVVARGYRRAMPPVDPTGTDSAVLSRDTDFTRTPKRPR